MNKLGFKDCEYVDDYNGFIYVWIDKKEDKYYIGSHFGKIDDGYKFGGIAIKAEYNKRPNDFHRIILEYCKCVSIKFLREIEHKYLLKYNVKDSDLFYNRTNTTNCPFKFNKDKIIINKLGEMKFIYLKDLSFFINDGWSKGRPGDKIYVNRNNIIKYINKSELELYIKDGWVRGREKGKIHINKNGKLKQINPLDIDKYIKKGWTKGGLTHHLGKIHINKNEKVKLINFKDLDNFIIEGWTKGGIPKQTGKIHINKNGIGKLIYPKDLKYYIKNGWIKGRIKKEKNYISYKEAVDLIKPLNLKTCDDWAKIRKRYKNIIPSNPRIYYNEWIDWTHFLSR